jgi:hypothetical protein
MVDASAIGMTFEPAYARVEPGRLRFFLDTLGETNRVYRAREAAKEAGFAERPIPPTYLSCLELMDRKPFEMLEALKIDISRTLALTVVDVTTRVANQRGETVAECVCVLVVALSAHETMSGNEPARISDAASAAVESDLRRATMSEGSGSGMADVQEKPAVSL